MAFNIYSGTIGNASAANMRDWIRPIRSVYAAGGWVLDYTDIADLRL
jgi:hypothetical protein